MPLPPPWKLKRELRRIYESLLTAVRYRHLVEWLRLSFYEMAPSLNLRETHGALTLTSRVAVFVLFQPKAVAPSTLITLEYLAQEGWSVLVISNSPLSREDRDRLASKSAQVIERPNLGYDFGAYREGWRWLHGRDHRIVRLILMNDSTWFPLRRQDDSLRRMEMLNADLAGHIFKTVFSDDPRDDHVESHLLMFGPRALLHPDIHQFWATYRMTNSRALTIKTGEVGISQAAIGAGLTVKGLLDRDRLLTLLEGLNDDELSLVVANLVLDDADSRQLRADWRAAAATGM
ncbi:MAG TPA: rhamnan synthesis F family protein, partial [Rhizobium sp.]|nr:rhamnan synthesis F family protein [Rhizobium sp.]